MKLGRILNGVIAHAHKEVSDFSKGDWLDRFNFWTAGVWYVKIPWKTGVGEDETQWGFIDKEFGTERDKALLFSVRERRLF